MKIYCPKCKLTKDFLMFNKHTRNKTGRQGYCRVCEKEGHKIKRQVKRDILAKKRIGERIDLLGELWKPIQDYTNYEISNMGRVYSILYGKIMFQSTSASNGKTLKLRNKNGLNPSHVHRLVAFAFIPNPLNKKEVDHIDNNRSNNKVSNLQWATRSEQIKWAYERGRDRKYGESNKGAKLTNLQAQEIRTKYKNGARYSDLVREYPISESGMCLLLKNKSYVV